MTNEVKVGKWHYEHTNRHAASQPTRTSGFRYLFTSKHHGRPHSSDDAQWHSDLTLQAEFDIFELADTYAIYDEGGHLFGLWRAADLTYRELGARKEQVAIFPVPSPGNPWHGFPLYPLKGVKSRSGAA